MAAGGWSRQKDLRQTVFIAMVLVIAGRCLLTEIPFRRAVDRELHAVLWDAWGQEQGETDLRIRGTLTRQLGRIPKFEGVFEVEGYPYTLEENGGWASIGLEQGPWSDFWDARLRYNVMSDETVLGNVYTDLSFQTVLILLPNQGRWMGYAAPAKTPEEARELFQAHIPVTREPLGRKDGADGGLDRPLGGVGAGSEGAGPDRSAPGEGGRSA